MAELENASTIATSTPSPTGEARMLEPLLAWLRRTRRINSGTHIAIELAWFGRRIDLATLTTSERVVAYELKLGALGRALEQASYNRVAFDRSYVVTGSVPRADNIALAKECGIGLILVRGDDVRVIVDSPRRTATAALRSSLLHRLRVQASYACV